MKKSRFTFAVIAAIAATFSFGFSVDAETLDAIYCGGSFSSGGSTTFLCSFANDGYGPRAGGGGGLDIGALFYLSLDLPSGPVGENPTLFLPHSNECDSVNWPIEVFVVENARMVSNNTANWVVYAPSANWTNSNGGIDNVVGDAVGEFDCTVIGTVEVPLALSTDQQTAFETYGTLLFRKTGPSPNAAHNWHWYDGDTALFSYLETGDAPGPSPTTTCAICDGALLNPIVSWGESTSTVNVTSTFQNYLDSVIGNSTTTIPGCYLNAVAETMDTFLALTSGGLEPQTIQWNMGTGTGATFEIDLSDWEMFLPNWVWEDLRPIAWNIFAVFGWAALGWFIWNDWMGDTDRNVDPKKAED